MPVERSTCHYRSRRAAKAHLIERIREIAATRVRHGYRRIHVLHREVAGESEAGLPAVPRDGPAIPNKTPRPHRKRLTISMTRRFLHSVSGLSSSADAWRSPTQRGDPRETRRLARETARDLS
jgi:hypothetical protein